MSRAKFRQADVERLIKAAKCQGAALRVDLQTLVVTIIPVIHSPEPIDTAPVPGSTSGAGTYAPDGKENWDED
jgi:hypothetical protein